MRGSSLGDAGARRRLMPGLSPPRAAMSFCTREVRKANPKKPGGPETWRGVRDLEGMKPEKGQDGR